MVHDSIVHLDLDSDLDLDASATLRCTAENTEAAPPAIEAECCLTRPRPPCLTSSANFPAYFSPSSESWSILGSYCLSSLPNVVLYNVCAPSYFKHQISSANLRG